MEKTYEESLSEVYKIIEHLEYEEYNKIPKKFLDKMYENMDKDYYFKIIVDEDFVDNQITQNAKEILALIYRDYLVTPQEREQLLKEEAEEERKIEQKLREKYNPDNIFKNNKQYDSQEELSLVAKEDNVWYKKLISKIIDFFKRKIK